MHLLLDSHDNQNGGELLVIAIASANQVMDFGTFVVSETIFGHSISSLYFSMWLSPPISLRWWFVSGVGKRSFAPPYAFFFQSDNQHVCVEEDGEGLVFIWHCGYGFWFICSFLGGPWSLHFLSL